MEDIFEKMSAWQRETFPQMTTEGALAHLKKERREALRELRLLQKETEGEARQVILASLLEEMADMVFMMNQIALVESGETLGKAVAAKLEKNKRRTWHPANEEGVYLHVKETSPTDLR